MPYSVDVRGRVDVHQSLPSQPNLRWSSSQRFAGVQGVEAVGIGEVRPHEGVSVPDGAKVKSNRSPLK